VTIARNVEFPADAQVQHDALTWADRGRMFERGGRCREQMLIRSVATPPLQAVRFEQACTRSTGSLVTVGSAGGTNWQQRWKQGRARATRDTCGARHHLGRGSEPPASQRGVHWPDPMRSSPVNKARLAIARLGNRVLLAGAPGDWPARHPVRSRRGTSRLSCPCLPGRSSVSSHGGQDVRWSKTSKSTGEFRAGSVLAGLGRVALDLCNTR
jgi:hypothetical protein